METTYFFYSSKHDEKNAFRNGLGVIVGAALPLTLLIFISAKWLDSFHNTGNYLYYQLIAGMLLFDALAVLPFAQLRRENKAKKFALLKFLNIILNVAFNLLFFYACSALADSPKWGQYFNPAQKVFFIFVSNFLASAIVLLAVSPQIIQNPPTFKFNHIGKMLKYAWPLIAVGIAAAINETFDKPLLEYLLPLSQEEARAEIGIYGAAYRLGIAMVLVVQAFKFAAEPFFFSIQKNSDAKPTYALVLKWFVIVQCLVFLAVALNIDSIIHLLDERYHAGKNIVAIVLLAQMCLGIYYNLSVWYKLTEKTIWGMYMSFAGLAVTLMVNFWLVPIPGIGYLGAALATLSCYLVMMLLSFIIGRKYYPIPYQYGRISLYVVLSVVFWLLFKGSGVEGFTQQTIVSVLLILLFMAVVWHLEKPKNLILLRK
ncbi:MAG: polysaccharide biosynthesis protein [Bacteroidetes bacterium]|nr:polysaccharide biosynthesis protein [Bacteroidota bacterium]